MGLAVRTGQKRSSNRSLMAPIDRGGMVRRKAIGPGSALAARGGMAAVPGTIFPPLAHCVGAGSQTSAGSPCISHQICASKRCNQISGLAWYEILDFRNSCFGWIPDVRKPGDASGINTGGRLPLVHDPRIIKQRIFRPLSRIVGEYRLIFVISARFIGDYTLSAPVREHSTNITERPEICGCQPDARRHPVG